jgi:hypothetical protein
MVPTFGSTTHVITPGGASDATHYSRSRHWSSAPESFRGLDRLSHHHRSTQRSAGGERFPRRIGHRVRVRLDRRSDRASGAGDRCFDRSADRFGSFRSWVCGYGAANSAVGDDGSECGRFDISELSLAPGQFFGWGRIRQHSGNSRAGRSERQPVARDQRPLARHAIRQSNRGRHGLLPTGNRLASCAEGCHGTNRGPVQ